MGRKMKKIFVIGLVLCIMVCLAFAPMERQVVKAGTTITITFDPYGNVSLDVSPATWPVGVIYANSSAASGITYFNIWNNGTVDNMSTTIQITTPATNFTLNDSAIPTGFDNYSLNLTGGSISGKSAWVDDDATIELDDDLDVVGSDDFGFVLYISNITQNFSTDTIVCTLVGSIS